MTRIKHLGCSYNVRMHGITVDGSDLQAKFDTGAVATIITAGAILQSSDKRADLADCCELNCVDKMQFESADGGRMQGYLLYAKDVSIGCIKVTRFYYYLIPDMLKPKILLGDDFIACCDFAHIDHGDILIKEFHADKYRKDLVDKHAVDTDSILHSGTSHVFG